LIERAQSFSLPLRIYLPELPAASTSISMRALGHDASFTRDIALISRVPQNLHGLAHHIRSNGQPCDQVGPARTGDQYDGAGQADSQVGNDVSTSEKISSAKMNLSGTVPFRNLPVTQLGDNFRGASNFPQRISNEK
jgi:hypothetical protein